MDGLFDSFCHDVGFHPEFLKLSKLLSSTNTSITVLGPVYTALKKFEKPSTLVRHENKVFRKRPSNRWLCVLVWTDQHVNSFGKRSFWKRWHHAINVISLPEFSSNINPFSTPRSFAFLTAPAPSVMRKREVLWGREWRKSKMTGDCCVFKFVRRSVNGKHLMSLESEISVFNLLRGGVDGAFNKHTTQSLFVV